MKPSSVVVLARGHGDALEVFWSQRQHAMAFLGGFWAFAGGSVEAGDGELPLRGEVPAGFPDRSYFGCAARETFEEMGVLVTTEGVKHVSVDPDLTDLRNELHNGADFGALLRERAIEIDANRFSPIGKWETPDWFNIPFDSEFFGVELTPAENEAFGEEIATSLLEEELIAGEWTSPADALAQWRAAERYITLPIRLHLESLLRANRASDVDVHSAEVPFHYTQWLTVSGLSVVPLKSPTIPPATHTNCIIVGEERFVLVDPGSPYAREQDGIATLVQQKIDDGHRFEAIVLTHHHSDHVAGVADLMTRFGCEVWAHEKTASQVEFAVARELDHNEVIELGEDSMRCIFTPGHASGHLCLHHERTNAVLCGDLIASSGTILINPPDGHMGDYLASLEAVAALDARALIPAHGWVVTNPRTRLEFYRSHRLAREAKVLAALRRHGPAHPADLVPDVYDDAPVAVWPIAARSAAAHLIHLVEIGRAARQPDGRYITGEPA